MNRFRFAASAAVALVVLASPGAAAQAGDFPEIRAGQTRQESLDASSPRSLDGRPFKVFQFQARPGSRYTARMSSSDFDSYVVVARMNAGITEDMREDDDGGEGTDARVRFTVPAAGSYLLIARGFSSGAEGSFTLALTDEGPITVPPAAPVRVGASVQGSLTDTDGFLDEGEKNYDLYVVRGQAGADVHVMLASEAFDAYLEAGEMVDGAFRSEVSNDDYDNRDAAVQVRLNQRGEAMVRATSLGSNQEGAYTLTVRAGRLPPREEAGEDTPGGRAVDSVVTPRDERRD